MNLVKCYVTEIIGEPYFKDDFWWQVVTYETECVIFETAFFSKEKSYFETISVGFEFFA